MIADAASPRITTQIGSLPFDDVETAIAYSLEHDIPFLPELTALGDAMMEYIKSPGALSCLDSFKKHRFDIVKVQCIGPATLIQSGFEEDDAVSRVYAHVEAIVDGLEADQIILFLDEPALGYVGFDYIRLWEPIFESFPCTRGIHTCGNMQWDALLKAPIDIISFDATKYDITKYYEDRGDQRIAWGAALAEHIRDFRPGDLITPPCGLPALNHTTADAQAWLETLQALAD